MTHLYTYFVTSAPGGATQNALRCRLAKGSNREYLVCLKRHYIDVYSLENVTESEDSSAAPKRPCGPILTATIDAHTTLLTIAEYRPPGAGQSHILVVTSNLLMLRLTFDEDASKFIVNPVVSLQEPAGQEVESEVLLKVDPNYNLILFHGLKKVLKCIVLDHDDFFFFNHVITMRTGESMFIDFTFMDTVYRAAELSYPGHSSSPSMDSPSKYARQPPSSPPKAIRRGKYILECKLLLVTANSFEPGEHDASEYWYSGIHMFFELEYLEGNRRFNAYGCSALFGDPIQLRKRFHKFLPLKLNHGGMRYDSALLLGSQALGFLSFRDPRHIKLLHIDISIGDICSFCAIVENKRYLIGDNIGALYLVDLETTKDTHTNVLKRRAADNQRSGTNRTSNAATWNAVCDVYLTKLGVYSPPTALIRIAKDMVYIATAVGNCRTVRLKGLGFLDKEGQTETLETQSRDHSLYSMETWKQTNLGPIMDFTFGEKREGGSPAILTCCGYGPEGRVCSVAIGIGINVFASYIMDHVRDIILLEEKEKNGTREVIMCCVFFNYSRFYKMSIPLPSTHSIGRKRTAIDLQDHDDWIITRTEAQPDGFVESERTILLTRLSEASILQVTTGGITVVSNANDGKQAMRLNVPKLCSSVGIVSEIGVLVVSAMICDTKLFLLLSDHHILTLDLADEMNVACWRKWHKEISAISYISGSEIKKRECSGIIALSTWDGAELSLLCPETLEYIHQTKLICGFGIAVSALRFCVLGANMHLFVALSDGALMLYMIKFDKASEEHHKDRIDLILKNIVKISDTAIGLAPLNVYGESKGQLSCNLNQTNLVTTGDNPTLVYVNKGKMEFVRINTPNIYSICSIAAVEPQVCFGVPLMYIGPDDKLCIGFLDTVDQLHVDTICSGRSFDKICYHEESELIVVSCAGEFVVDACNSGTDIAYSEALFRCQNEGQTQCPPGMETLAPCAKFISLKTKEVIHTLQLPTGHAVSSVTTVSFEGQRKMIAIGTACMSDIEDMPTEGHIYLVDVVSSSYNKWEIIMLRTVSPLGGGVVEMTSCNNALGIALNDTVIMMSLSKGEPDSANAKLNIHKLEPLHTLSEEYGLFYLVEQAEYVSCTYVVSLNSYKDTIVVGDLMNSVRLLQWTGYDLKEVSRDFNSMYCTAVAAVDSNSCIVSDSAGNLCIFAKRKLVTNDRQAMNMEDIGLFHHGENINKIVMNPYVESIYPIEELATYHEMPEFHAQSQCKRSFCCLDRDNEISTPQVISTDILKGLTKPSNFWNYSFKDIFTCATSAGSLMQLCLFDDDKLFYRLAKVEDAINNAQTEIGNIANRHWRTFKNKWIMSSSKGFIDGDIVESFLELDPDLRRRIFNYLQKHDKNGFFYSPELLMLEIEHIRRLRR